MCNYFLNKNVMGFQNKKSKKNEILYNADKKIMINIP